VRLEAEGPDAFAALEALATFLEDEAPLAAPATGTQ
jgi:phosphotransferase system HPr-like phosphotransfer protein